MHILLLHIYLNTMFEFSCLLTHCQSQFHLIFNHFGVFFVVWTKVHEIPVQLFHLIKYKENSIGAKAKLQKLYSIHAALYTAKASNAAVYTAKASYMFLSF